MQSFQFKAVCQWWFIWPRNRSVFGSTETYAKPTLAKSIDPSVIASSSSFQVIWNPNFEFEVQKVVVVWKASDYLLEISNFHLDSLNLECPEMLWVTACDSIESRWKAVHSRSRCITYGRASILAFWSDHPVAHSTAAESTSKRCKLFGDVNTH